MAGGKSELGPSAAEMLAHSAKRIYGGETVVPASPDLQGGYVWTWQSCWLSNLGQLRAVCR